MTQKWLKPRKGENNVFFEIWLKILSFYVKMTKKGCFLSFFWRFQFVSFKRRFYSKLVILLKIDEKKVFFWHFQHFGWKSQAWSYRFFEIFDKIRKIRKISSFSYIWLAIAGTLQKHVFQRVFLQKKRP